MSRKDILEDLTGELNDEDVDLLKEIILNNKADLNKLTDAQLKVRLKELLKNKKNHMTQQVASSSSTFVNEKELEFKKNDTTQQVASLSNTFVDEEREDKIDEAVDLLDQVMDLMNDIDEYTIADRVEKIKDKIDDYDFRNRENE